MSDGDFIRFEKHLLLEEVGFDGQRLLKNAKVLVIGAGGLGCPITQYLASNGIGTLGIVDHDTIALSNLHRQILYTEKEVGLPKVQAAKEKLQAYYSEITLHIHEIKLTRENAALMIKDYDLIIDGSDNFATRYMVNDMCVQLDKPLVYGSILKFEGQVAVFNHQGGKNLRDIFPEPPNPEDVPSCSENGVLGTLPGIIGLLMAQEALKLILQLPVLHNEWVIFDTLQFQMRKIKF
ncbi:thiamine biosynthesis protein ThiF [Anditalea andensis]|uniref:Molybdopterin-synthase adenylyltransferase n=1 Tax=Anditalea andensis TaxID=1048983 RepID=A0A074KUU0_9BACT|nr:thiamine biosynthesis protein ThiF [Anditalea andensis]